MYGIDSGNGYVYGDDPAVEHIEKDKSEEGKKTIIKKNFPTVIKIDSFCGIGVNFKSFIFSVISL